MNKASENITRDVSLKNSIFRIGYVFSVDGLEIKIKVDKRKNSSHLLYKGDLLKNTSVGGYLKIAKGFTSIIAKVGGEYIKEEKYYNYEYKREEDKIDRILKVQLLGYIENGKFERGIKELPLIYNQCFLLDKDEFSIVHDFVNVNDKAIKIGSLALEKGQDINIGINSVFASHIGIFGNTGSGKSYTLAKIYRELFLKFQGNLNFKNNAKFFILDFNGEYVSNEFGNDIIINEPNKSIYELSTSNNSNSHQFPISKENINNTDFWVIILDATEKTQKPFLQRVLKNDSFFKKGYVEIVNDIFNDIIVKEDENLGLKAMTNLLSDLYDYIENKQDLLTFKSEIGEKLGTYKNGNFYIKNPENDKHDKSEIKNIIKKNINDFKFSELNEVKKIGLKIILKYHSEIVNGHSNVEHLSPLIKRLDKRIDELSKIIKYNDEEIFTNEKPNLVIVSLKNVGIEMKKMLPLLMCKQLYDEKKAKNENTTYLNIIIDEAHNILSYKSDRESETWKDYRLETFEEIIKEGRKFGVFLTIASQRPSDISSTIISQLHNYFIHRLINERDIEAVGRTISYLDKVSHDTLPILPTGTCIFAGLSAHVPVVVKIDTIEPKKHEPDNKTINLIENWVDKEEQTGTKIEDEKVLIITEKIDTDDLPF